MTMKPKRNPFDLGHPLYYDRQGKPITMEEWCEFKGADPDYEEYSRVGSTYLESVTIDGHRVPGTLWVSTVWVGLNMSFTRTEPLIFETMVFYQADCEHETGCRRYATEEEAIEGHRRTVESLQQGHQPFAWVNEEHPG